MGCPKEKVTFLPEIAFDTRFTFKTAPAQVAEAGRRLTYSLNPFNNRPINEIVDNAEELAEIPPGRKANPDYLKRTFSQLEKNSVLMFSQWTKARQDQNQAMEFASAKLFNHFTTAARKLDGRFDLVDKSHLVNLGDMIRQDMASHRDADEYSPHDLAKEVEKAAREHTHEKSWLFVMLPTFPRQHYGRVLLQSIDVADTPGRSFITQSSFTDNHPTLFHTHGQNWAISRPLGKEGKNRHLNSLWEPNMPEKPFPLQKITKEKQGEVLYSSENVVAIPPRVIHTVMGKREEKYSAIDIKQWMDDYQGSMLAQRNKKFAELAENAQFGEYSSLHLYRPDPVLARSLKQTPLEIENKPDPVFFEAYDMIVFDQHNRSVWAGGGGAWERRMIDYGPTGEHCGQCFVEHDSRRENLDPKTIYEKLIAVSVPSLVVYKGHELVKSS